MADARLARGVRRGWLGVAAVVLPLVGLAACAAYRQLMGENTVSLRNAEVLSMETDIRRPVKKICPREPVQMWVRVDTRLGDQSSPARLETWEGDQRARRNGKLDFGDFAFTSPQGVFDELGWFHPRGDMLATVERGFEIQTALRFRPDRFVETRRYEPEYSASGRPAGSGRAAGAVGMAAAAAGAPTAAKGRPALRARPAAPASLAVPAPSAHASRPSRRTCAPVTTRDSSPSGSRAR